LSGGLGAGSRLGRSGLLGGSGLLGRGGLLGRAGLLSGFGRGRGVLGIRSAAVAGVGEISADFDDIVFLGQDLLESSRLGAGDLRVDLVGGAMVLRFVNFDVIDGGYETESDCDLCGRLTVSRHLYGVRDE